MRILDRYILRQVGGSFLFGVALFTLMLLASFELFGLVRFVMGQDVGVATALRLLALRVPRYASLSIPMALLLGALMAVGRLSDHNEVVALRTGGISLARVVLPVFAAGALAGVLGLGLSEYVVPAANERYFAELQRVTRQGRPARAYVLFREKEGSQVAVYYARAVMDEGRTLEGVVVHQEEEGRLVRVIVAARARFTGQWVFEDGILHELDRSPRLEVTFKRLQASIRRTPREILAERKDPSEMTISELRAYIRVLRRTGESVVQYVVWLHSRFALPLSAIPFAFLALPLGLRPHRSGSSIGVGLSVLIVLLYYVGFSIAVVLAESSRLPTVLAVWAPNLVVVGIGGVLLWRVR